MLIALQILDYATIQRLRLTTKGTWPHMSVSLFFCFLESTFQLLSSHISPLFCKRMSNSELCRATSWKCWIRHLVRNNATCRKTSV